MFCPKCGNQLTDMFVDKCLSCGMSFKNLSLAERRKLEKQPNIQNSKRPVRSQKYSKATVKRKSLKDYKGDIFIGIDAGSTTAKVVAIDTDGCILYENYKKKRFI